MTNYPCTIISPTGATIGKEEQEGASPQIASINLAAERDLPMGTTIRVNTKNGERVFEIKVEIVKGFGAIDRTAYHHFEQPEALL